MTIEINPCPEYSRMVHRYKRVRDIVNGEYRLKENDLEQISGTNDVVTSVSSISTRYLRYINPSDKSEYNRLRNIGFINGARLFNATSRTLSGLMGMSYRVPPKDPDLAPSMKYLIDNVDGAGTSLIQQAKSTSWNVTQIGRHGLLTDMPRNEDGKEITISDVNNGFRATIQEYTAENIKDWNEAIIGGAKVLDLLVLREITSCYCDKYRLKRESVEINRVYRLTNGIVTVQIYKREKEGGFTEGEEIVVTTGGGKPISRIPFSFVGSVDNSPDVDTLPLEPLSDTNLGHYQESANLRSSSYQLSAAQPVISDDNYANYARNKKNNEDVLDMGEESTIVLGTGGSFSYHSPDPNNISSDLLLKDEERMVALGAQLVLGSGQAETAEAARIKRSSDVSTLDSISMNVGDAYTQRIKDAYQFMGVQWDEAKYVLSRDFFDTDLTPDEAVKLVSVWQGGAISKAVLDANLKSGGVISEDTDLNKMNDAIEEEAASAALDFGEGQTSQSNTVKTED